MRKKRTLRQPVPQSDPPGGRYGPKINGVIPVPENEEIREPVKLGCGAIGRMPIGYPQLTTDSLHKFGPARSHPANN
nr:hypothetical protein [uncultured Methanoregula sp.]